MILGTNKELSGRRGACWEFSTIFTAQALWSFVESLNAPVRIGPRISKSFAGRLMPFCVNMEPKSSDKLTQTPVILFGGTPGQVRKGVPSEARCITDTIRYYFFPFHFSSSSMARLFFLVESHASSLPPRLSSSPTMSNYKEENDQKARYARFFHNCSSYA